MCNVKQLQSIIITIIELYTFDEDNLLKGIQ